MSLKDELTRGMACDTIRDATTVAEKAVCLAAHPGKIALFPLVRWFEARYHGKYRFARLTFLFDLFLLGVALGLGLIALAFWMWKPTAFVDKISFDANVAPLEVVSGAASTLVMRYENRTGEELRDAHLSLVFPDHFLLQEGEADTVLGTIAPGATGSVKIRGVMFGDVGGVQRFRSRLTFTHGESNAREDKFVWYEFYPVRSTLALSLSLPDQMVASQPVDGSLAYRNAGDVDFPQLSIEPEWPEGFALQSSDVPLVNGAFTVPAIAAGEEGTLRFRGTLGENAEGVEFVFRPSFTFGDTRYRQETLTHAADVVPLPLQVSHSIEADTVRPGGSARVTLTYANIGEETVTNARVGVESDSPFARAKAVSVGPADYPELARVEPGETGTLLLSFPLLTSISQSATRVYENIPFTTRAFATFDAFGSAGITTRAGELTYTMTSPVVLDAFARYAAPSGDQLGRGPLPPLVGQPTKYWVFWNVRGTTNALTNVRVEGELGANVAFTGRQTVSQGAGVVTEGTEIVWTTGTLSPTLSPSSKIVGIAFELAITPGADQLGTIPTLLRNIRVTGTDAVTGAFVSASGATITTNLPNDAMATGHATVE